MATVSVIAPVLKSGNRVWYILPALMVAECVIFITNNIYYMDALQFKYIFSSVVYALLGVIILVVAFWLVDRFTPENTWKEIVQNKNIALAIVVAAFIIAIGLIISSAIHG
ncbi:DUF350 domain-containing protein [Chitinophaga sp. 30R24]|uniref:DUF350 domain-containing protein n=1 Tax=Chitinophaga sp. 30R24 TaxID=3248838 RepID=UPI003B8FB31D